MSPTSTKVSLNPFVAEVSLLSGSTPYATANSRRAPLQNAA